MKKNAKLFLVSFLAILTLGCFGACNDNPNDSDSSPGNEIQLEYADESVALIVGDEVKPTLAYTKVDGEAVTFSSSAPNVVTVDADGTLNAVNSGNAVITASYMDKTTQLNVAVGFGDMLPTLVFDTSYDSDVFSIYKNDTVDLNAKVLFNNKTFTDVVITYTCSGAGVVTDGIYASNVVGEDTVTISATWRGQEVSVENSVLTINTVAAVEIYVNDNSTDEFELYLKESVTTEAGTFEFNTTSPFVVTALIDNNPASFTGEFISGEDVVALDNGVITALKSGIAEYKVSFTDSGKEYSKTFKITVASPVVEYNVTPIRFSAVDGQMENVSYETLFGDNALISAKMGDTELDVTSGAPLGFKVNGKATPEETILTLASEEISYKVKVVPYTKILKTTEDLKMFTITDATVENNVVTAATTFDGYYVLGNDIVWDSAYTHQVDKDLKMAKASNQKIHTGGLTGTFDGNGHTVTGMKVKGGGLFGLVDGGTIKNVAFKDISITASSTGGASATKEFGYSEAGLAYQLSGATLQNVYMQCDSIAKTDRTKGFVAVMIGNNTKLDSCIFELAEMGIGAGDYNNSYGSLCALEWQTMSRNLEPNGGNYIKAWTNVYVISPVELAVRSSNALNAYCVMDAVNKVPTTLNETEYLAQMYGYSAEKPAKAHASDDFIVYAPTSYTDGVPSVCNGITRYDTAAEMITAQNNYREFDSNFWDTTGEVPVFKAKA